LINVHMSSNCTVHQTNTTSVGTTVSATSSTGDNHANENTGGDVTVMSGDASTAVSVSVSGGTNEATDPCCACALTSLDVVDPNGGNDISGNGADTTNKVKVKLSADKKVKQKNTTSVSTVLSAKSKTGKNKANKNTGSGVEVTSGGADTMVDVTVDSSSNTL